MDDSQSTHHLRFAVRVGYGIVRIAYSVLRSIVSKDTYLHISQHEIMKPIGFGIIGVGTIARYHAEAIRNTPDAELAAVCGGHGPDPAVEQAFGVTCEPDAAALLARSDVDAVCICTPSGLHAQQTIAAANAGKHVLVEKPMALTVHDADAMIAACDSANVLLGVALQRRTDPYFQAVREGIVLGYLGRPVLASVIVPYLRTQEYYESAAWRGTWAMDGGGALMNQAIHLVDLLLWFMGDIANVQAFATTLVHDIEVEDCLSATIQFTSGALGTITATTAAGPGFAHRVSIYGEKAGVQIEGEQITRARGDSLPAMLSGVVDTTPVAAGAGASPTGISAEGHTRLINDFVAAIQTNRPPLVSGEEGRRSLDAVLRIYAAAGIGRQ